MCKIPFSTVENMAEMCAILKVTSQPRYRQYLANNHTEAELRTVTHDFQYYFQESSSQLVFSPHPTLCPFMQCIKY